MLGTVHDYGDLALLLEFDSTAQVLAWTDAIRRAELPGVVDIVPAARTVLLKLAGPRYQAPTRQRLAALRIDVDPEAELTPPGRADVTLGVVYDGPDLDEVSRLTGLTRDEIVAAHTGRLWRVGFGGFAPGFAYLVGGDPRLEVPRRAEPRTRVPAGAVGLAGEFTGVYPRESPGGWQLIGRLADGQESLWDINRDKPALLTAGMWVQFREEGS
ncbi:allophanate hydrolase subunit 1 [Mycolicibacterium phlei]|uniref:Allophanate hydrolase n=1 Tax=Mycolicibacterium phlei DSM 43239 = CCUG 21000 TaxID=1226750 RepID=A0A5N5VCF2_MYCPH|nr:Kinase A inhibitor [Mycolicibacterium phlei]EID12851.1 allophanate hydrolase subunit 1 [Mycolicibacterium phlei RIVM601174]KAB7759555.1 allophanate hydrolase [Mycolicibacterium phlei DSM 43239 = CCUG 21000]KXW60176.1 allophanate hydrolase [Mycolicibacterium phlei DSM 43072]KXW72919.1 allophanate hydrolase [Mycolicibacterium phlei DSM 43070]VEG11704.1 allophanate hydrolase subunit 1 [Mycobacteroides chelonae]